MRIRSAKLALRAFEQLYRPWSIKRLKWGHWVFVWVAPKLEKVVSNGSRSTSKVFKGRWLSKKVKWLPLASADGHFAKLRIKPCPKTSRALNTDVIFVINCTFMELGWEVMHLHEWLVYWHTTERWRIKKKEKGKNPTPGGIWTHDLLYLRGMIYPCATSTDCDIVDCLAPLVTSFIEFVAGSRILK